MSRRSIFSCLAAFSLSLTFLAGCATPLPPTYEVTTGSSVLAGPILALAGDGAVVVAANTDGLFLKKSDGLWVAQETPGIRKPGRITCLAVKEGEIIVGTDGEGLHILSGGAWEVKASRYGGLADDGVLSVAFDAPGEGLPGENLWVGTRKGIAVRTNDEWKVYRPDGDWLVAMTGKSGSGAGKVYVSPGFKLGRKGGDSDRFHPPVSAISVGPDRVVFGNRNSGLAIVSENAVATLRFGERQKFTHLAVDEGVIWTGMETGLLWGGLKGHAEGKPWPTHWTYLSWSGTLFGSRDTRDFEYRWKSVGYNTARIVGLEKRGSDLWVAHQSKDGVKQNFSQSKNKTIEETETSPITDIRRFVEIDEYIARKQKAQYESYGLSSGIKGKPTALYVSPDSQDVFIGTTRGLWELEKY